MYHRIWRFVGQQWKLAALERVDPRMRPHVAEYEQGKIVFFFNADVLCVIAPSTLNALYLIIIVVFYCVSCLFMY